MSVASELAPALVLSPVLALVFDADDDVAAADDDDDDDDADADADAVEVVAR